jgi:hypothetical protein
MYNESVEEGDDLQETINYNFTADLIDEYDCNVTYDAGYLDTEFKDGTWHSKDFDNITTADLDNHEDYVPNQNDIYDVTGDVTGWVDLSLNESNDGLFSTFESTNDSYNYDGSYSFTNETVGTSLDDIIFINSYTKVGSGWIAVNSTFLDHDMVIAFRDNDAGGGTAIIGEHLSFDEEYGIMEFWLACDSNTDIVSMHIYDDPNIAMSLYMRNTGQFAWYDGVYHDVGAYSANTWYHLKIVFDCGTYGYDGLAADTWDWYIDGVLVASDTAFRNVGTSLDRFRIGSSAGPTDYTFYFDAFGFDWLSNYTVGDNYYWQYYPATYDLENYNVTLSENYIGTYSFEEDAVGGDPTGWVLNEDGGTVNVISNLGGHNKVLELHDTVNGDPVEATRTFSSPQTYGTIEWWWRTDDATDASVLRMTNDVTILFYLMIDADKFQYWDGGWNDVGLAATDDTWYHIRIDFECTAGDYSGLSQYDWNLFINRVEYGPYDFGNNEAEVDYQRYYTSSADLNYYQYIDAIGYSWDTDYCQVEDTWNFENDFKSWNKNPYNLTNLFSDNWDYYGVLGGIYSVDGEFDIHKKYLEIYDDSNTGYYPGTHSFEHHLVGTTNLDIDFVDLSYGDGVETFIILNEKAGHRKVMDSSTTTAWDGSWTWVDNTTQGSLEYWIRVEVANTGVFNQIFDQTTGDCLAFVMRATGQFAYHDGGYHDLGAWAADTWYHIRIEFDTNDDWHLWIDGVSQDGGAGFGYNGAPETMDKITFVSEHATSQWYLDGIGYSWDPNYIGGVYGGDNLEPIGCQVWNNFSSSQTTGNISFWMNGDFDDFFRIYLMQNNDFATSIKINTSFLYYLDNQTWTCDAGVTNAWHYVRIAFNATADTYDLWFDSTNYTSYCDDGIGFNLTLVDSDIPFQQDVSGIDRIMFETHSAYTVTYDIDALLYSWDLNCSEYWDYGTARWDLTIDADTFIAINDTIAGYTNVLNMTDWGAGGLNPEIDRDFASNVTNGSITFEVYINSTNWWSTDAYIMELWGDTTRLFSLQFYVGDLIYTAWTSTGEYYLNDTWIAVNVSWDATDYWLYINDSFVETGSLILPMSVNSIHFEMMYCEDGEEVYLDNIIADFWFDHDYYNLIPTVYAEMDFKIDLDVTGMGTYICYYLYWAFLTSNDERVNFSWYNFDTDTWDEIIHDYFMDTDGTPGPFTESYNTTCPDFNSTALDPYINSSNSMLFRFKILDFFDEFDFYFDELRLHLIDYVHAQVEKNFDWRGIWRYRWFLRNDNGTWIWTNYTYFELIPLHECANFEGISESAYTTYWELIGTEATPVELFADDMTGGTWDFVGISDRLIYVNEEPTDDSYVTTIAPNTNYGSHSRMTVAYNPAGAPDYYNIFLKYEYPYLDLNYTSNSSIHYFGTIDQSAYVNVFHTDDFNEGIVTWNNQPATGDVQSGWAGNTGAQDEDLGMPNYYYKFIASTDMLRNLEMATTEDGYAYKHPYLRHYLSKYYHGGGQIYMQTDESETLTFRRSAYAANTTIIEGDFINLDIQSSASDVLINLYSGGTLNTSLTVLSGNTDSSRRIVGVYIPSNITFDQIEFVGTSMEDEEYFMCYDLVVEGYEDVELYYDMYIDPDGQDYLMTQIGDYLLRIWDEVQEDKSMTFIESREITLTYELLTEIYIPMIQWNLKVYHYAQETSTILIYSSNETDYTTTLVENTTAGVNEIIDFLLENGTYILNWTNGENNITTTYNITLDCDRSLILDSSYFEVYFGLFTNDGLGLDHDFVRFYINGDRKDFGEIMLTQDSNALLVMDYFNHTLYSATMNLRPYEDGEWNIFAEIFTLNLFNNYTYLIDVMIERNDIEIRCTIPPQMSFEYRFIPNVEYKIVWYHENGTEIDSMDLEFEENGQIVSFGFYDFTVPYNPIPDLTSLFVDWALIFICIACIVGIPAGLIYKYKRKKLKEYRANPINPGNYMRVKKMKRETPWY